MIFLKGFLLNIIALLILDSLWLKFVVGDFFAQQLKPIGRFNSNGDWDVRLVAGALAYIVMALALEYFVFHQNASTRLVSLVAKGALLGFCLYGIFDFTNRAILHHYPLKFMVVDIFWGTTMFALVSLLRAKLPI